MLRGEYERDDDVFDEPRKCGPGTCVREDVAVGHADQLLPQYDNRDFQRNVEVLNRTLENFSFAAGVVARLIEEAFVFEGEV